jgi:putative nucleotidyltransferase with HDIG domain
MEKTDESALEGLMDRIETKNIIIDKVKALPTLPVMVHKVLSLVQHEDTTVNDLAKVISYDQAISSRILKVANSAYYGLMREIATISHAVVILGFREVKSLALGIMVFDTIQQINKESSIMGEEFWEHSIGCSLAGQIICNKMAGVDAETAFTTALLHDIGKLVLDSFLAQEYQQVLAKVQSDGVSMVAAEEEVLGFDHAEVGGWLCERWKFPALLTSAVAFHHHVDNADENHLLMTSIVHAADMLCKRARIGNSGDPTIPALQPSAQEQLKPIAEAMDAMVAELSQEQEKVTAFLSAIT